jgi:hypothetical protein
VGVAYSAADRRWHAVGAARISEFLLAHGIPVSAGVPTGDPSLGQIAHYLRMVSVNIRCWSTNSSPSIPPRETRRR